MELENTLVKSVRWNKHISVKLTGFINNLTALEKDKIRSITESYLLTKEEITRDIHSQIPELLQSRSDLVQEDSDFKLVHEELNVAMNERVQKHVQQVLLPKFTGSIQEWIETAHNEFIQAQAYLDEMSETFNKLYKEERMKLPCDFKLLDDWNRDVVRMTNRITVTNINILLRFTPTQFFLKVPENYLVICKTNLCSPTNINNILKQKTIQKLLTQFQNNSSFNLKYLKVH